MHQHYAFSLLGLAVCLSHSAHAQQPFERFGIKVKVATLSNGRYPEFFRNDSLRRIGSVVYNTRLRRIAYLLPGDSLLGRAKPEVTSRWFSPDPLAEKYMYITPYAFGNDNPVRYADIDGRDIIDSKGNHVTMTFNKNGSVSLGSNANADSRRVVNAMALTPTGIARLHVINDSKEIGVMYSINNRKAGNSKSIELAGTTKPRNPDNPLEDTGKENKLTVINVDNVKKAMAGQTTDDNLKGLTLEQAIGAVADHESVHGFDKKQIALELSNPGPTLKERERAPNQVEKNAADDIKKGRH